MLQLSYQNVVFFLLIYFYTGLPRKDENSETTVRNLNSQYSWFPATVNLFLS